MTPDQPRALRTRRPPLRYEDYIADAEARIALLLNKPCQYEAWRTQLAADISSVLAGMQVQMEYFHRHDTTRHCLEEAEFARHREIIAALPAIEQLIGAEPNVVIPWLNPSLQVTEQDVIRKSPWYVVILPPVVFDGSTPVMHMRLAYMVLTRDERELRVVPSDLALGFTGSMVGGQMSLPPQPDAPRWVVRHGGIDHPNMSSHIQCHEVGSGKTALVHIGTGGHTNVMWQNGKPTTYPLFPEFGI